MLQGGYSPKKTEVIPGMTAVLAQLLHCLIESVACPMSHVLMLIRDQMPERSRDVELSSASSS
jgi:hypothetical protein